MLPLDSGPGIPTTSSEFPVPEVSDIDDSGIIVQDDEAEDSAGPVPPAMIVKNRKGRKYVKKQKKNKFLRPFRRIARVLAGSDALGATVIGAFIRGMCFLSVVVVFFCVVNRGRLNGNSGLHTALTSALSTEDFDKISSWPQYWDWVNSTYIPTIHAGDFGTDGEKALYVLHNNRRIGGSLLRQVRVKSDTCTETYSPIMAQTYDSGSCYGGLTGVMSYRDMTATAGVTGSVLTNIDHTSHGGYDWHTATELDNRFFFHLGQAGYYAGAGQTAEMFGTNTDVQTVANALRSARFLDAGSRAAFLTFTVYNGASDLLVTGLITAEHTPEGSFKTSLTYQSAPGIMGIGSASALSQILGLAFVTAAVLLMFISEVFECCVFTCSAAPRNRPVAAIVCFPIFSIAYFVQIFNLIDILNIASLAVAIAGQVYLVCNTNSIVSDIDWAFDAPPPAVHRLTYLTKTVQSVAAVAIAISSFKLFKYLSAVRQMSFFLDVFNLSLREMMYTGHLFALLVISFGLAGLALFGQDMTDFSSLGKSMFAVFKMVIMEISYDDMTAVAPLMGAIYYVLFIVVVLFVLLNIFIAIVSGAYDRVRVNFGSIKQDLLSSTVQSKGARKAIWHVVGDGPDDPRRQQFVTWATRWYHRRNKMRRLTSTPRIKRLALVVRRLREDNIPMTRSTFVRVAAVCQLNQDVLRSPTSDVEALFDVLDVSTTSFTVLGKEGSLRMAVLTAINDIQRAGDREALEEWLSNNIDIEREAVRDGAVQDAVVHLDRLSETVEIIRQLVAAAAEIELSDEMISSSYSEVSDVEEDEELAPSDNEDENTPVAVAIPVAVAVPVAVSVPGSVQPDTTPVIASDPEEDATRTLPDLQSTPTPTHSPNTSMTSMPASAGVEPVGPKKPAEPVVTDPEDVSDVSDDGVVAV